VRRSRFLFLWGMLILLLYPLWAQAQSDSLKICALRVDFMTDQNELTTGDGRFMIDTVTTDPFAFDPTPHDRLYFEDQILAAANYFKKVSKGKLLISGDVYPLENDEAYHLPHEMGWYNPNTTEEAINLGIANLFKDAVEAANAGNYHFDFSRYDLVVVFHAGVGKDVSVGYDTTPQDIPSLYLTKKFLQASLGSQFDGIIVNNGQTKISSGILLPETENQDDYQLALTGMFVSNIGSHLGLYDLFSPSEQTSGAGSFAMMDAGLFNMGGLVPAPPCAFSRILMGWDEPVIVNTPVSNIEISRYFFNNPENHPTAVKIPINENEYFLLENRGDSDTNIDSLFSDLIDRTGEVPGYMELLKLHFTNKIEISPRGVLLSVPNYDWGLPGDGILIWHIDERVIAEKGPDNEINDDPDYRAVDLEEADASQDLGQTYSLFEAGYQKELGWFADFWFKNRPDNLKDFELYENEFSPDSKPSSSSNLGANSHITLKNFSNSYQEVMTFDYSRDFYEDGFPLSLPLKEGTILASAAGKAGTEGTDWFFTAGSQGSVFAAGENGTGFFFAGKNLLAEFASASIDLSMALGDSDSDGNSDVLFLSTENILCAFSLSAYGADSLAQEFFPVLALPAERKTPVIVKNNYVYTACVNDSLYKINFSGQIVSAYHIPEPAMDFVVDNSGQPIIPQMAAWSAAAAPMEGSTVELISMSIMAGDFAVEQSGTERNFSVKLVHPISPQFAVADADNNGVYDFIFNGDKEVFALDRGAVLLNEFPINPELENNEYFTGTPLILDLDDDGQVDFISATNLGRILAFDRYGRPISDFPVSCGGLTSNTPIILQLDDDAELELMAVTNKGTVCAWQLPAEEGLWLQENLDASNNTYIDSELVYKPVLDELMPKKLVYNYPNPNKGSYTKIRYYLNEQADVSIKIYDAAGIPVKSFSAPGRGGEFNELKWELENTASGIYLCRVKAKAGGKSSAKIIKIMVIH